MCKELMQKGFEEEYLRLKIHYSFNVSIKEPCDEIHPCFDSEKFDINFFVLMEKFCEIFSQKRPEII